MESLSVRDAMGAVPAAVPADTPVPEILPKLAGTDLNALPVVDTDGRYRGVITTRQLERALADAHPDAVAGELAEQPPTLSVGQSLKDALPLLLRSESSGLPVLGEDGAVVVGWLTHRDVLHAYQSRGAGATTSAPRR
jgi:CIC family chloride channel protein